MGLLFVTFGRRKPVLYGREFQSPALVLQGEFMEKDASFQTAKYSTSFGIVIYIYILYRGFFLKMSWRS